MIEPRARWRLVLEVVGIISVVISVVFLALQVRQGNQVARATVQYELMSSWNEFHDLIIGDSATAKLLIRMADTTTEFTAAERRQIVSIANRLFNTWTAVHHAYENGLIDRETYESMSSDIPRAIGNFPVAVPIWRTLVETYPISKEWEIFEPLRN